MLKKYKIMIVDDSDYNRSLLTDILENEYDVIEAADGLEAVKILERQSSEILVVLLDIMMPRMDGFEVLSAMRKRSWLDQIAVIMISAETSSSYVDHAYDLGATDYIARPFDEKTVRQRVKNTIVLASKQKQLEEMVTDQIFERERTNQVMVEILSNIVEFRNRESGLHILHVRLLTEMLLDQLTKKTERYNLSLADIALIVNASALHDIGKILIPETILNKPGRLTPEETAVMQTHTVLGEEILSGSSVHGAEKLLQVAKNICRWHHEKYDGRGYPDGLVGEEIPIAAQVVSLADCYDALTNERVYKPAYSHERAMEMILDGECGAFNPLLLRCLKELEPKIKKELQLKSSRELSRREVDRIAGEMIKSGGVSNRTLALLEEERQKYQFFALMSNEILFEYNFLTKILTFSEWGASKLGLPEIIPDPLTDARVIDFIGSSNLKALAAKIKEATHEQPVILETYEFTVSGQRLWFKIMLRPIWSGQENSEINQIIGKIVDIDSEHQKLEGLKFRAERDSLTGLFNAATAVEMVCHLFSEKRNRSYVLCVLDLDFFKNWNDSRGHLFGNKILKAVASRLLEVTQKEDIVARIGGDEFMIVMGIGT